MPSDLLIASARIILRPINSDDSERVFNYRSDAVTNRYQGFIPKTIGDVHDFIANKTTDELNIPGTWFQLVILMKETSELIGDIGIHFLKSDPLQVELGCTLALEYQGKGFAAEALTETIDYLAEKLNKRLFLAYIDPKNTKSIRLFEQLGFSIQEQDTKKDSYPDDLRYVIRKKEWEKQRILRF